MPTLTPAVIRSLNTFVELAIMSGRKSVTPNWDACAILKSQANATGTYAWLNDIPVVGYKQASGYTRAGVAASAFQILSEEYGLFLEIKKQDVRDDNTGVFKDLPGSLGRRMAEFPQKNIWTYLKEGDQSTINGRSNLAHDGLAFFHDSHYTDGRGSAGGTYDNNLTSTALSKANFEVAIAALANFPDQRGEIMGQKATHLCVPPQLAVTGADILLAQTISTGGSNTSNLDYLAMRGYGPIKLVIVPELSGDATTWYVTAMGDGRAPIIWQETEPLSVVSLTSETDQNMINDNLLVWACKGESGFGFADPRCAIRCIA